MSTTRCSEGPATELADRLEHGIERLLASESLDALAVRDAHLGPRGGDLSPELLHQRGLADARLTGDEDDLELSRARVAHALPELGESGRAPHEAGLRRRYRRERGESETATSASLATKR